MLIQRFFRSPGLLLAVAGVVLGAAFIVPWWERDFFWDSAIFGSLAQSLIDGEGYRYMGVPHGKYPPGLPLMLAAVQWLGLGVAGMHALIVASAVLGVVLAYVLLREIHGRWFAFIAAGLTLVNHAFLEYFGYILSDLPYLAFTMGALCAAQRVRRDGRWRWVLLTLCLCVAAASVRAIGVVLVPAIALGLLARRRDAQEAPRTRLAAQVAVIGVPVLALVGAWLAYGGAVDRSAREDTFETVPYHHELTRNKATDASRGSLGVGQYVDRVRYNSRLYPKLIDELLDGRSERSGIPTRLPAAILGVGWLVAFWRRRAAADYYVAGYAAVLSVWSGAEGVRFLIPLLPLLYDYAWCALAPWSVPVAGAAAPDAPRAEWPGGRVRASQLVLAGIAALTLATSALPDYRTLRAHVRRPFYTERAAEFRETMEWVVENTPDSVPIVTDKAPMAYMLTGRLAYKFATVEDTDVVFASIERRGRPVVIVNDFHSVPRFLKPLIAERPEHFREIHRIGGHVVYQFEPEPDGGGPAADRPVAGVAAKETAGSGP